MKVVGLLCVFAFVCVSARSSNVMWMEIMSAQMIEADRQYKEPEPNIPQKAVQLGLNDLVKFVKAADLVDTLSSTSPLTVFGPSDKAFGKLPAKFVEILDKNKTLLQEILKYHVVEANATSSSLSNDLLVPSLQGSKIRINIYPGGKDKIITASGRVVTNPDNFASNGVIHEVNGVLFPAPGSIKFVVAECPIFSTLNKALGIAGLAGALGGEGHLTLFAPSDCAFGKIPKPCLEKLLEDKKKLTKVLLYHVVNSTEYSAGLKCGQKLETLEGQNVVIHKMFGRVKVDCSYVTYADGTASNGVIHVINKVLFPKDMNDFCPEMANENCDDGAEEPKNAPFIF